MSRQLDLNDPLRPAVSIVTPCFNQGAYLDETIRSVLDQTYKNIELIVIDDGSTDNTGAVMERYTDRAVLIRQENQGQSAALNKGWALSRGAFLGYLSSDDLLKSDAIERLVERLVARNDLSLVYPDYDLIDGSGGLVRTVQARNFDMGEMTQGLICHPGVGAIFRRAVFDETGGWRVDLRQVADFEFFLRASRIGRFERVPQNLAAHRIHDQSASFRPVSPERADEIIEVASRFWNEAASMRHGDAETSQANAHLISARIHARSQRGFSAIKRLLKAYRLRPRYLLDPTIPAAILYQAVRQTVFDVARR